MSHDLPPAHELPKTHNLPKTYDPSAIEERWAAYWVRERLFDVPTPGTPADTSAAQKKFTMLLPPPNVTGYLHMGHMFEHAESDIMMRWHRMRGETAVWVPGTDHAGIATQMLVERKLASEGTSRQELGREAFTARVWEWKRLYGSAIADQMKRLGVSVDWGREYFTMDDRLSVAVREAFVRLHEQGLIYRGAYIVNWDPEIRTAVSDLEVVHEERPGKLFYLRYPLADGPLPDGTDSIVIATTRPETMLGDTAVVVNPTDPRYGALHGKLLRLPLSGINGGPDREVPILADDWARPEFGTGAVKVTPAHDPNDFAIGQRHNLPSPTILDETAHILLPGSPYHGLDRYAARETIVADLDAVGLLVKVEDHTLSIGLSQRSGVVIEPRLSNQWFVSVNKTPADGSESMAAKAIRAVAEGHIRFTPDQYRKTYDEWMSNIHDWCISRQLWWGHRIPAWHCATCTGITVARDTPSACTHCNSFEITQETDVLDTWFSSGLLPFTIFGWPEGQGVGGRVKGAGGTLSPTPYPLSPDLASLYPTQLLITGFDILFFWVARMIMLGCHFMLDVPLPDGSPRSLADAVPFRNVYIHALIRDADRQKMSKTKGNVIDPIDVINRFGTDAVRFTLASMASPGTDIAFSEARTEGNRAFANKIWNAARFLFMNIDRAAEAGITIDLTQLAHALAASGPASGTRDNAAQTPLESRWILSRLSTTAAAVDKSLDDYRFDEAANAVYQFFWGDFCDWYLEIIKLRLEFGEDADLPAAKAALTTLLAVFESALRLLSPFMPFITEEIWHALYDDAAPQKSIALASFPQAAEIAADPASLSSMELVQELIVTIRRMRKNMSVPEKQLLSITVRCSSESESTIKLCEPVVLKLARGISLEFEDQGLSGDQDWASSIRANFMVSVGYEPVVDIPAERERLSKDLARFEKGLAAANRQLSNDTFMSKAPSHIVEGLRKQAAETRMLYDKAKAALDALPSA